MTTHVVSRKTPYAIAVVVFDVISNDAGMHVTSSLVDRARGGGTNRSRRAQLPPATERHTAQIIIRTRADAHLRAVCAALEISCEIIRIRAFAAFATDAALPATA